MRQQARVQRGRALRHALDVAPAGAGAEPVRGSGVPRYGDPLGRQYRFAAGQAHLALLQLVATPVDLVHPRVDGRGDPLRTLLAVGPLGQDRQVGDRQYRALQGEGQALDHADGDAHAGEGARTAPEGDGVHRGQGDAGLVEQVADHRQQALGVQARDHLVVTERPPLVEQGDGAGFGGGIQGQQSGHRRFRVVKKTPIVPAFAAPETPTARLRAVGATALRISSGPKALSR